jgi:hypothetical protein
VVAEHEMQQVQFVVYANVDRFTYKNEMRDYLIDAIREFDGVTSVEETRDIELRTEVRFDLVIELERPAEHSARSISESLLDYIIGLEHVSECRELSWRRLKSPRL